MKKFISDYLVSIVAVVGGTIVTVMFNLQFYFEIEKRGGFEEWANTNPFWDCAIAYVVMWNVMYILTMWFAIWFNIEDRKLSRD